MCWVLIKASQTCKHSIVPLPSGLVFPKHFISSHRNFTTDINLLSLTPLQKKEAPVETGAEYQN